MKISTEEWAAFQAAHIRLAGAAPDLLAVAEAVAAYPTSSGPGHPTLLEIVVMAQDAITKVKGAPDAP